MTGSQAWSYDSCRIHLLGSTFNPHGVLIMVFSFLFLKCRRNHETEH